MVAGKRLLAVITLRYTCSRCSTLDPPSTWMFLDAYELLLLQWWTPQFTCLETFSISFEWSQVFCSLLFIGKIMIFIFWQIISTPNFFYLLLSSDWNPETSFHLAIDELCLNLLIFLKISIITVLKAFDSSIDATNWPTDIFFFAVNA